LTVGHTGPRGVGQTLRNQTPEGFIRKQYKLWNLFYQPRK